MDRSQYNECVEQYADGLFRFVFSGLRKREEAEDVVQESFARVWEKVRQIDYKTAKSYLYTTAYHLMIDETRRCQRLTPIDDCQIAERQSHVNTCPDVSQILGKALATLPEIQRTVIVLRDYEGYSYQEIGDITNLTESQVKVYIFRGRTALKKQLKSIDNLIDTAL